MAKISERVSRVGDKKSEVDLGQEFGKMIETKHAHSANVKTLEANFEMMKAIIDLRV
jgi:flagellar hook protein FlgE